MPHDFFPLLINFFHLFSISLSTLSSLANSHRAYSCRRPSHRCVCHCCARSSSSFLMFARSCPAFATIVPSPFAKLRPRMAMVVVMLEGCVAVEDPPDIEMVVVDLLSIDEEMMNSDEKPKIVPFRERMDDRNVPSSSSTPCSYAFSILSAR
ncbi:putative receptor-like protein kinase [Cucumis melo var. makuwa]|uniref:Putative receptor-like protein kinase n=1 Tax=Cucumis melo var. makuwa TaxID=1194695 RepID=A0A5D3C2T1_CUCMM|nr:putative receptor-like protein kinase [Cucumis melo var. makuwa]